MRFRPYLEQDPHSPQLNDRSNVGMEYEAIKRAIRERVLLFGSWRPELDNFSD